MAPITPDQDTSTRSCYELIRVVEDYVDRFALKGFVHAAAIAAANETGASTMKRWL